MTLSLHRLSVAVCGAFLLMACVCAETAQAQAPSPAAPAKWEYAELFFVAGPRDPVARYSDAKQTITDTNLYAIYTQLGGELKPDEFHAINLLNILGAQGWELVGHVGVPLEEERVARVWAFKRALKSSE
jgi:hypothetical protein